MTHLYWLGEPRNMTQANAGLPVTVQPTVWAGDDFASAWQERLTRPVTPPMPPSVKHEHDDDCLGDPIRSTEVPFVLRSCVWGGHLIVAAL